MLIKCKLCGKRALDHRHTDKACPVGRKHKVMGYLSYSTIQFFEPKEVNRRLVLDGGR